MSKTKLRIVQDFVDFNENKPKGIYIHINKDDIFKNYALIIGPSNTPYFGGFYFFEITFPKDYPKRSPVVKLLTVDKDVRFNPNLYECGKVCLSILGTWSGPGWTSVMNLRSVLLSIQSLLHEFPIINEPGYEETKQDDKMSISYNHYLIYYNYKVAIMNVLNNIDKIEYIKFFKENITDELKINLPTLSNNLKSYQIVIGEEIISRIIYFIRKEHHLDFISLNTEFHNLINDLKKI